MHGSHDDLAGRNLVDDILIKSLEPGSAMGLDIPYRTVRLGSHTLIRRGAWRRGSSASAAVRFVPRGSESISIESSMIDGKKMNRESVEDRKLSRHRNQTPIIQ
jgi:hypothetical protein